MFCTDDAHPADFVKGHIDRIVRRAIADGYDAMDVLRIACLNPVRHYGLRSGLLQPGDSADFIALSDLSADFRVLATYLRGVRQNDARSGGFTIEEWHTRCAAAPVTAADLAFSGKIGNSEDCGDRGDSWDAVPQIVATDGSLLTGRYTGPKDSNSQKIVSYNRYTPGARPQVAYIRGFEIARGAIAQTIAHDCHNIIAVGSDDELIAEMINRVIAMRGGIAATDGSRTAALPLPVGGIMSDLPGDELAALNLELEQVVRSSGCPLKAPFITLAFMALPVIPELKLTDRGLFDGTTFKFI